MTLSASILLVPNPKYNHRNTILPKQLPLYRKKLLMILSNDTINKYPQLLQNRGLCQKNEAQ